MLFQQGLSTDAKKIAVAIHVMQRFSNKLSTRQPLSTYVKER